MSATVPWWDHQFTGTLGGVIGTSVGLWCSLVGGTLWLVIRSNLATRIAVVANSIIAVLSAACVVTGIYAISNGQPYHVWYAFMVPGILLLFGSVAFIIAAPRVTAQYNRTRLDAQELRDDVANA